MTRTELRKYVPSAAAALLFTALLAQAPHAATVFIRIAPQDVQWEVWWLAILGGVVYAIALESATAYFVWRNKMRWAIAFAAFSIMHNVAYYMPGAWTFDVAGAQLSLRYIVSALLISASLPIAIAAFSHVHVEEGKEHTNTAPTTHAPAKVRRYRWQFWRKPLETPAELPTPNDTTPTTIVAPVPAQRHSEAAGKSRKPRTGAKAGKLTQEQRRAQIKEQELQSYRDVMRVFNVSKRTADGDLAEVRKAVLQTNGTGVH